MSMSIVFDRFPDRKSADRFAKKVKENFGLDSVVYNDMRAVETAEKKDFYGVWHPFECKPFIVHTDRAENSLRYVRDKDAIKAAAKKHIQEDGEFYAKNTVRNVRDKDAIKAAAKKRIQFLEEFYANVSIAVAIEQAVEHLAKSCGGKFVGT
jgi:hypothetical protein